MNDAPTTINPNKRLSARIQTALRKGREALAAGLTDLADDYLTTAEGLAEDLAPEWKVMASPALDGLADAIVARQAETHNARKGEGAFSYAE